MTRQTPEQLQEARRKAKAEREKAEAEQEAARVRLRQDEERRQAQVIEQKNAAKITKTRYEQLISATDALYEEVDKLNKKGPTVPISELSLTRVNKIIRSVKILIKDDQDEFVDDIQEFIPAGNMPEYRDVTLVLSQAKAGLSRFYRKRERLWMTLGI